jgi:hypothetical protein
VVVEVFPSCLTCHYLGEEVEVAAAIGLEEAAELHKIRKRVGVPVAPNCNILAEARLAQGEDLLVVVEQVQQVKYLAQVVEPLRVVEVGLGRANLPIEEPHPSMVACWIALAVVNQRKRLQYRVEEERMTYRHCDPSIHRPSECPKDPAGHSFVEDPIDWQLLVVDLVQDHVEGRRHHLDHHPWMDQQ